MTAATAEPTAEPVAPKVYAPWTHIVGALAGDPKPFSTRTGSVLKFVVRVDKGFKDDNPDWYDIAVWNEGLQEFARRQLYKGATVAVSGEYSENTYNEQTRKQISAQKVGLIQYGTRTRKGETVAAQPKTAADELDF